MSINRGKQFEQHIRKQFEKLDNTFVLRLYDVTMGYSKIDNPCDLIVFKDGTLNLFECKAIHGNTLNFKSHIRENQWNKLLEYSKIEGVNAGILCWFIDKGETLFLPIQDLEQLRLNKYKSFNFEYWVEGMIDYCCKNIYILTGHAKKIFFDYELEEFLEDISYEK